MTNPVHLETLRPPESYPKLQLDFALRLASILSRGRLVLLEEPQKP